MRNLLILSLSSLSACSKATKEYTLFCVTPMGLINSKGYIEHLVCGQVNARVKADDGTDVLIPWSNCIAKENL